MVDRVPFDPGSALLRGLEFRRQREADTLRNRLLMQQEEQATQAASRDQQLRTTLALSAMDRQLQQVPEAQREQAYQRLSQHLTNKGFDIGGLGDSYEQARRRLGYESQLAQHMGLIKGGEEGLTEFQRQNLDLQRERLEQQRAPTKTPAQKDFETYQKLKKDDPEAAQQFGRKTGFISNEGQELSVHLQKRLSEANDLARDSRANAVEFDDLANKIQDSNIGGGIFGGTWVEAAKEATGNQDAVSMLKKRYFGIRASQVSKNLPPGAASDADIQMALSGFPKDTANKEEISSFLRGLAKLEQQNDVFNTFKAEYISAKGSERDMLKAWREQSQPSTTPQGGDFDPVLLEFMTPEERALFDGAN